MSFEKSETGNRSHVALLGKEFVFLLVFWSVLGYIPQS
jgi:hypothetical protein